MQSSLNLISPQRKRANPKKEKVSPKRVVSVQKSEYSFEQSFGVIKIPKDFAGKQKSINNEADKILAIANFNTAETEYKNSLTQENSFMLSSINGTKKTKDPVKSIVRNFSLEKKTKGISRGKSENAKEGVKKKLVKKKKVKGKKVVKDRILDFDQILLEFYREDDTANVKTKVKVRKEEATKTKKIEEGNSKPKPKGKPILSLSNKIKSTSVRRGSSLKKIKKKPHVGRIKEVVLNNLDPSNKIAKSRPLSRSSSKVKGMTTLTQV